MSDSTSVIPGSSKLTRLLHDERAASLAATALIIAMGLVLGVFFQPHITAFGEALLATSGQATIDSVLFVLTGFSSTLLMLPIWVYALVAVAMGYSAVRVSVVMALGSATGSLSTLLIGRRITRFRWVARKFPNLKEHPWTNGRSKTAITLLLFFGTASPLPCDVVYLACGVKKYPALLFYVTMVSARTIRYLYLCYGFDFILHQG